MLVAGLYEVPDLSDDLILFEDDKLIIFNKPAKVPVHPGGRYQKSSVVQFLEKKLGFRPVLAYRLDREASGLLVLVKDKSFLKELKIINKSYSVVVKGFFPHDSLVIKKPIGEAKGSFLSWKKVVDKNGKPSETRVFLRKHFFINGSPFSLLRVSLLTGRQHQIRVHLSSLGFPVFFDKIYDNEFYFLRYLYGDNDGFLRLHLSSLEVNGVFFHAPLPDYFFKPEPLNSLLLRTWPRGFDYLSLLEELAYGNE